MSSETLLAFALLGVWVLSLWAVDRRARAADARAAAADDRASAADARARALQGDNAQLRADNAQLGTDLRIEKAEHAAHLRKLLTNSIDAMGTLAGTLAGVESHLEELQVRYRDTLDRLDRSIDRHG